MEKVFSYLLDLELQEGNMLAAAERKGKAVRLAHNAGWTIRAGKALDRFFYRFNLGVYRSLRTLWCRNLTSSEMTSLLRSEFKVGYNSQGVKRAYSSMSIGPALAEFMVLVINNTSYFPIAAPTGHSALPALWLSYSSSLSAVFTTRAMMEQFVSD